LQYNISNCDCQLSSFIFLAQDIVDAIKNCSNLKTLNLQGNTLGVEAARIIADALKEKKSFQVSY